MKANEIASLGLVAALLVSLLLSFGCEPSEADDVAVETPVSDAPSEAPGEADDAEVATPVPDAPSDAPSGPNDVRRVSAEEVKANQDAGQEVTIVDVRGANAFDERHIAGALSVPMAELRDRLAELPREGTLVFY